VPGQETDKVADKITKQYHLECESSRYSPKILIRIVEYDAQIALDNAKVGEDVIVASFPHTAVLYLRSTEKTPDKMHVVIEVPEDSIEYEVPVTQVSAYTIDEIFEKKLYLLIPFYIFTYESGFSEYNINEEKLESLKQEYQKIIDRLNVLTEKGEISSFDQRTIIELADDVMKKLTRKYNNIQREVGELMSGAMIQTEARKIRDEGIELGRIAGVEQGRNEGKAQMLIEVSREDGLDDATILNRLQKKIGLSLEAATSYLEQYGKSLG
jgi:ribosome-binding factor A